MEDEGFSQVLKRKTLPLVTSVVTQLTSVLRYNNSESTYFHGPAWVAMAILVMMIYYWMNGTCPNPMNISGSMLLLK